MARQVERRERTRLLLIEAATYCFETMGYAETSLDDVLLKAQASKGALYHHFPSKTDLLEAVFNDVSHTVIRQVASVSKAAATPREALSVALKAWLRAILEPRPRRILLDIGPGILGFSKARKIELAQSEAGMEMLINRIISGGEGVCTNVSLAARLLNAAVTEMALTALDQPDDGAQLDHFDDAIDTLIAALVPRLASLTKSNPGAE